MQRPSNGDEDHTHTHIRNGNKESHMQRIEKVITILIGKGKPQQWRFSLAAEKQR